MRSILRGRELAPDSWRHAAEGGDDLIVPLERLLAEADTLRRHSGRLGVKLAPPDDVLKLEPFLDRLELIEIEFPAFGEGRGYSQAHLLRERLGYEGEIRAVGIVKQDQVFFMQRSGFDAFELSPGQSVEAAIAALGTFSADYQTRPVRWR